MTTKALCDNLLYNLPASPRMRTGACSSLATVLPKVLPPQSTGLHLPGPAAVSSPPPPPTQTRAVHFRFSLRFLTTGFNPTPGTNFCPKVTLIHTRDNRPHQVSFAKHTINLFSTRVKRQAREQMTRDLCSLQSFSDIDRLKVCHSQYTASEGDPDTRTQAAN